MEKIIIKEPTFIPLKPNEKGLIGIASVLYNNSLSLNCISVYLRPDGELRLLFPDRVLPNSKRINIYYPITRDSYEAIKKAIADKYEEITVAVFLPMDIFRKTRLLIDEGIVEQVATGKSGDFSWQANGYRFLSWKPPIPTHINTYE